MKNSLSLFTEIPCLTERSSMLSGVSLQKKWFKTADKRIMGQYLQKFIDYNSEMFHFLGVVPYLSGSDQNVSLSFGSSEFIGAIPLRSSDNGKQIGDFLVSPRFSGKYRFEEYIEILNLLEELISTEFVKSLPLKSNNNFKPPLYLEALKFLKDLETLLKTSWRKFDTVSKTLNLPTGQIDWNKYSNQSYKVENRLKFPSRKNILTELHQDYEALRYVFDLCKKELLSPKTPIKIKHQIKNQIKFLEERLYFHKSRPVPFIKINYSDSPKVKLCKVSANRILQNNFTESTAWRVDFNEVFEKYIQYIFKEVCKETGARLFTNTKLKATTKKDYPWQLNHLEPDAIYQKGDLSVFIDAKYKSNLYNKFSDSDKLKDTHRQDLHQILAYSSFTNTNYKCGFLCYPSQFLEMKEITYKNHLNNNLNIVIILGVPLDKESISSAKKILAKKISIIEKLVL